MHGSQKIKVLLVRNNLIRDAGSALKAYKGCLDMAGRWGI